MKRRVATASAAVVCCGVVAAGCSSSGGQGAVAAAVVSARPAATVLPIGTFPVAQYQPGSELWPPPSPIGPQVVPPWLAHSTPTSSSPPSTAAATSMSVATSPSSTVAAVGFHPADAETADAVTAAVGKAEAAFVAAGRDPDDPMLREAIVAATVPGSQAAALLVGGYDTLVVEQGRWAVAPTDGENSVTVVEGDPGVLVDSTGTVALVTACSVNGDTLMGRDETGDSVVLAPGWLAVIQIQGFLLVDGTWKLLQVTELGRLEGARSCDEVPTSSSAPPSS
jgi:hypothetical protein